jgi:hypothetical protein
LSADATGLSLHKWATGPSAFCLLLHGISAIGAVFDRPRYKAPIYGIYAGVRFATGIQCNRTAGDRRSPLQNITVEYGFRRLGRSLTARGIKPQYAVFTRVLGLLRVFSVTERRATAGRPYRISPLSMDFGDCVGAVFDRPRYKAPICGIYAGVRFATVFRGNGTEGDRRSPLHTDRRIIWCLTAMEVNLCSGWRSWLTCP